jgi:hypothetical protein
MFLKAQAAQWKKVALPALRKRSRKVSKSEKSER